MNELRGYEEEPSLFQRMFEPFVKWICMKCLKKKKKVESDRMKKSEKEMKKYMKNELGTLAQVRIG